MSEEFAELLLKRPNSLAELIEELTPTIHENLKTAIELGKWSDGSRLSPEQVDLCMQAVILYESQNLEEDERLGADIPAACSKKTTT